MSGPGGVGAYVWTDSEVNRVLENAVAAAKKAGVSEPETVTVKARDTAGAIAVYAENNGFDHVVVGTGGKSAISRLMLGSVSRYIVHRGTAQSQSQDSHSRTQWLRFARVPPSVRQTAHPPAYPRTLQHNRSNETLETL